MSTLWKPAGYVLGCLLSRRAFLSGLRRSNLVLSFPWAPWIALAFAGAWSAPEGNAQAAASFISILGSGFHQPNGVAVDGKGNVVVADYGDNEVYEIPAVNGSIPANAAPITLGSGFNRPFDVAVDGKGDVFVADYGSKAVKEIPASCIAGANDAGCVLTLASGFNGPEGVAVDGSGNVYVADSSQSAVYEFLAVGGSIPADATPIALGSGFSDPDGIAVDGKGNVFVADDNNGKVYEIPAVDGSIPASTTPIALGGSQASHFTEPAGLTLDGNGNLLVADFGSYAVFELPILGGYTAVATLGGNSRFNAPSGVAVDGGGNVFVADTGNNQVEEFNPQGVNFGSVNVCPSGQTAPTPCSTAMTLNVTVTSSGTLGTPRILTQGAPDLDFTLASGNTCTGDLAAGASCQVMVDFAPRAAGMRSGAVEVLDQYGDVLAAANLYGSGTAPAIAFSPSNQLSLLGGFGEPVGVAVDASENVYVTDADENYWGDASVFVLLADGGYSTEISLGYHNGFNTPVALAVDGGGNVFVADSGQGAVDEIPAAGGYVYYFSVGGKYGFDSPSGLAFDSLGNLFVTDSGINQGDPGVYEIPAGGNYDTVIPLATGSSFGSPQGVAVDGSGNLFVTDSGNEAVYELLAAGGYITANPLGGEFQFAAPQGVAVDASGNVFIADNGYTTALEILPAGGYTTVLYVGSGFGFPSGVAVDGTGNLFVVDESSTLVQMIQRSVPPALNFATTHGGSSSSDSPQLVVFQNIGNATLTGSFALSDDADFAADSSAVPDCSPATLSLAAGAECSLSFSFTPQSGGPLSSTLTLTDNALNGSPAGQTIQLSGTGLQASQTITFTGLPSTATYGAAGPYALNATASSGLPVIYAATGPATLSGSTLTITGAGTVTVTASQSGDAEYAAGTPVTQTIVVGAASQTITFGTISTQAVGTPLTLTATSTSGLTVTFASSTPAVCLVSGNAATFLAEGTCTIQASQAGDSSYQAASPVSQSFTVNPSAGTATGLQFIPITPCRVADTRNPPGPFGGPEPIAETTTTFPIPQSGCKIPSTAVAYSLNVTVVPNAALGYLTVWPTGQARPPVSTLNSDGRVKANAAIVPAGTNGAVSVYVTNSTQVILDIDGYFAPVGTKLALAFYPVTPCRVVDTRNAAGALGGPSLVAGGSRAFPVQSSDCKLPSTAQAYSLNMTAVPHTTLGYLTIWPTGEARPIASTLNASTGAVTANAAIVTAGSGGDVSVVVDDAADVILDVNGYFAAPATGGLSLYPTTPCRVIDTRPTAFSSTLTVKVEGSPCAPPAAAEAYVLNATVVPNDALNYLTLWPAGASQPTASTLNAADKAITSNLAIVPTTNGEVDAFADGSTNLVLDLSGYFAP
jgi:sugar lactone lactonase YvrE